MVYSNAIKRLVCLVWRLQVGEYLEKFIGDTDETNLLVARERRWGLFSQQPLKIQEQDGGNITGGDLER